MNNNKANRVWVKCASNESSIQATAKIRAVTKNGSMPESLI